MSYKLYLDDIRPVPEGWVLVKDYHEFVQYITDNGLPIIISFDHDLHDSHYPWNDSSYQTGNLAYDSYKEKTGYDCTKWLVEYVSKNSLKLPKILIHTQNPIGGKNIITYLVNAKEHLDL